jgi:hypothetical protein
MPWSVEIHHIFIGGAGDSTLIVARHPVVGANPAVTRTVLIDGGRAAAGTQVHNYLNALALATINVIAVTHFDEDHYYGIIKLLNLAAPITRYDNAIIYDCGQLPAARLTNMRQNQYGVNVPRPSKYQAYRAACIARLRTHATRTVNSDEIARYDANDAPQLPPVVAPNLPPTWLLGKDIMWGNGAMPWVENPPAWAPGAPTLRCVVANKWVRQAGAAAPRFISEVDIYNGPNRMTNAMIAAYESDKNQDNAKSLGFLLEFNNFRYYVAGDLERAQEDGSQTIRAAPPAFYQGVKAFVSPMGTAAQRVLAMKTSHHGAATASSRYFLTALRPSAAFISNGYKNRHWHPFARTVNSLDGYPENPPNASPANRHGAAPPPPPLPPIANYLTGYQRTAPPPLLTLGGTASQTAGPNGGHVRLDVTEAQSQRDQRGQVYRGVSAALTQFSATAALGLAPVDINSIADLAVTQGAVSASGRVLNTAANICSAGAINALMGADTLTVAGAVVPGLVSAGVAAAAGGAAAAAAMIGAIGPGRAAAAGAGTTAVLSQVVTAAPAANISAAGLLAAPGNPNGVNAAAWAAATVSAALNVTAGGYAAMAAMAAAMAGASVGQATVIGAVVGAQAGAATAALTVTVVRIAAIAAGVGPNNASAAALVAGVAGHGGTPANVAAATLAALTAHGIAVGIAGPAAAAAQVNATVANTDLFTVGFQAAGVAQNINHSG